MNNSDWQVHIEYRPSGLCTFVYVSRRKAQGIAEFLTKGGDKIQTIDIGKPLKDEVYFAKFEDDYIGSLIVEALEKRGIKAPSQSYIEGKLEAKSEHLNDLRRLIPKLTPEQEIKGE